MTVHEETTENPGRRSTLADLARNVSYEVMPFKNTEKLVLADVPTSVPLTVTVTEARGMEPTLGLTERLVRHGYHVTPHLPARQFVAASQVADVVHRLRAAGVTSVFVIGGDVPTAAGPFQDAYSLLQAMEAVDHPFDQVGIAGYPEGHGTIPQEAIDLALKQKASLATRIVTQMCFHAGTTASWAQDILTAGVDLPVYVGMPGPVHRQKLVRITARLGLGQSARFLHKQHGVLWRFLLPGAYSPARLTRRLGAVLPKYTTAVSGLHIFTFNELHATERWRRELLASVPAEDS